MNQVMLCLSSRHGGALPPAKPLRREKIMFLHVSLQSRLLREAALHDTSTLNPEETVGPALYSSWLCQTEGLLS